MIKYKTQIVLTIIGIALILLTVVNYNNHTNITPKLNLEDTKQYLISYRDGDKTVEVYDNCVVNIINNQNTIRYTISKDEMSMIKDLIQREKHWTNKNNTLITNNDYILEKVHNENKYVVYNKLLYTTIKNIIDTRIEKEIIV